MSEQPRWKRALWIFCWCLYFPVFYGLLRAKVRGQEHIPREGPLLLLANHVSTADPPNVAMPCRRTVHFMATEQLFRGSRAMVWLITSLNAFPKAKGIADRRAMMNLLRRYKGGDIVLFFPEGVRSWTGRTQPVVPNTAEFLRRIQARVVYARIKTGHLLWPRWAAWPRLVPLEIEYSPLHVYDNPDQPLAEIEDDIARNLRVVPEAVDAGPLSLGFRMAEGLPAFLWACPACFALESLQVVPRRRSEVTCTACQARWRLDASQRLWAQHPPADDLRLATAYDRVLARFGSHPVADADTFARDGVVLSEPGRVSRIEDSADGEGLHLVARGTARLYADRIGIYDPQTGAVLWEAALADIKAVLAQLGNHLHLRAGSESFQFEPEAGSRPKWIHFTEQHWQRARDEAGPPERSRRA